MNGARLNRCCLHRGGDVQRGEIVTLSMPFYGLQKPGLLGEISMSDMAAGKQSTTASTTGPDVASGSKSSPRCRLMSIPMGPWLMPQSFAHISTPRVEKGGQGERLRTIPRWLFNQDPRTRRHSWKATARRSDGGPTSRSNCCGAACWGSKRSVVSRRHSV